MASSNLGPNPPHTSPGSIPRLPLHEWVIVGLILFIMAMILFTTSFKNRHIEVESPHVLIVEEIEVKISGAIEKPGLYVLSKNATFKELMELAKPLPEADIARIKMNKLLRDGQKVRIAALPTITINVTGAVSKPGYVKLLKGSSYEDLLEKLDLLEEADTSKLPKKRKLKDKETVQIKTKRCPSTVVKREKLKKVKK